MNNLIRKITNHIRNEKKIKSFLISFYLIGIAGMALPVTAELFLKLTPPALVMSFLIMLMNHQGKAELKEVLTGLFIFIAGILIEIVGVKTGLLFGDYRYGDGLGFKIAETPILIGMNWLMLVYATAAMTDRLKTNSLIKVLTASLLMVVYDIITEQMAPELDMWYWKDNMIPFRNYLAWFIIALFFHTVMKLNGLTIKNRLAGFILIIQFLFFSILLIMQQIL